MCGCVRVVRGDRRGNEEPQSILMTRNCLRCGGAAKCVKTMSCVNPQSANNYMHSHTCVVMPSNRSSPGSRFNNAIKSDLATSSTPPAAGGWGLIEIQSKLAHFKLCALYSREHSAGLATVRVGESSEHTLWWWPFRYYSHQSITASISARPLMWVCLNYLIYMTWVCCLLSKRIKCIP